jgi:NTE family protein
MELKANAVFEGGGVKGIGIVGALAEAERRGYQWVNVAGTSAGAIIAALIAAGYRACEIKKLIFELDYTMFKDRQWLEQLPFIGPALSLWFYNGLYEGNYLEGWIKEKLANKGIITFKDITPKEDEGYPLIIIATDVTRKKLLRLPVDFYEYNLKPEKMEVCKAVRMSAGIPFYYKPVKLAYKAGGQKRVSHIIDGGVLSNFPVWIFDREGIPSRPTFGFKIIEPDESKFSHINNPFDYLKAIVSTMLEAHDKLHELNPKSRVRTISIPSLGIKTTDFEKINLFKEKLYHAGIDAARQFFATWNFESFKLRWYGGLQS